jgi:hypothetical protein
MSVENVLSGRVETYGFNLQANGEEVSTDPVYRLVIDVSGGNSVGRLQLGYYIKINDSVYFVVKKAITVARTDEAEKVFAFLAKTKLPFAISDRHLETLSGHQYVEGEYSVDTVFYTVREFKVFRGLWRVIEGELYQNLYSPYLARFTDGSLDWYVKLMPEDSLKFKQVSNITVSYVDSQGHLDIYKISSSEPLPGYLYSSRKKLVFFNHTVEGNTFDVIPLGLERRILSLGRETTIVSPDHEPIVLPMGQYLLYHPRPSRDRVD